MRQVEEFKNLAQNQRCTPMDILKKDTSARELMFAGIIASVMREPQKTRGTDYVCAIILKDPSIGPNHAGLTINIFRTKPEDFPAIQVGKPLLVTVKITAHEGKLLGVSYTNTKGPLKRLPENDKDLGQFLTEWWSESKPTKSPAAKPKRATLVKDMVKGTFYCTAVQIVGMGELQRAQRMVYVTDYTTHNDMMPISQFNIASDFLHIDTKMIVGVCCWDEMAIAVQDAQPGDYVLLSGVLFDNKKGRPELVARKKSGASISFDVQDEMIQILQRRAKGESIENTPPNADMTPSRASKTALPLTSSVQSAFSLKRTESSQTATPLSNKSDSQMSKRSQSTPSRPQIKPLTNVGMHTLSLSTIKDVLESIEDNSKYLIKGRVIGFLPLDLQKMVRVLCGACSMSFPIGEKKCDCTAGVNHVYALTLVIQDNTDQIQVFVSGQEAVTFFQEMEPKEFEQNKQDIFEMLGRLFTLEDGIIQQSSEFELLIASYRKNGQKYFKLFN
ncbi:hypothetical protein EDD86DRAFT_268055, partial [Gorgonomyces haynaldii]